MSPQVVNRSAALLSPVAAELLQQVRDDPSQPMSVAVCGAGGYGKTALLHEVAASYRTAGVAVSTWWQPAGDAPEGVLLIDDAHRTLLRRRGDTGGPARVCPDGFRGRWS